MSSEADLACLPWTDRDYARLQELRARVKAAATVVEAIDRRLDNTSFADWDGDIASQSGHFAADATTTAPALCTRAAPTSTVADVDEGSMPHSGVSVRSPAALAEFAAACNDTAPDDDSGPSEAQFDTLGGFDSTVVADSAHAFAATSRGPGGGRALNDSDQAELVALEGRYSAFMRLDRERREAEDPNAMDVGAFLQRAGKASWFWTSLVATASAAVASRAGVIKELHHWDVVLEGEQGEGHLILGALPVVTGLDHITMLKGQCQEANRELGLIVSCMHEDEMHGFGLSAFATHSRWYRAFNVTPPAGSPVITSPTSAAAAAANTPDTSDRSDGAEEEGGAPTPTAQTKRSTGTITTAPLATAAAALGAHNKGPMNHHSASTSSFRCMLFQIDDCSATGATETQMVSTVHAIHDTLRSGRSVYVHCKAGKGRSWMVVACYLLTYWVEARRHGNALENFQVVEEYIRSKRPQVSPSGSQLQFAKRYAEFVLRDMNARERLRLERVERARDGDTACGAYSNGVVVSHHQMQLATAASV